MSHMTKDRLPGLARRQLLIGAGGVALAGALPGVSLAAPQPFGDSAPLRKALVHPATWADFASCELLAGANPFWMEAVEQIVADHAALVRSLESAGTQLLYLEAVLQSAIDEARRRGAWASWLAGTFPKLAGRRQVSAATLLGRDLASPGDDAMHSLFEVRDFAVMVPRGLVLAAGAHSAPRRPAELFRFMTNFAPELQGYPVVFDARQEGVRVAGRDIMVWNAQTLLVGAGADPRSAAALTRRTGMDVIAAKPGNALVARVTPDDLRALALERA